MAPEQGRGAWALGGVKPIPFTLAFIVVPSQLEGRLQEELPQARGTIMIRSFKALGLALVAALALSALAASSASAVPAFTAVPGEYPATFKGSYVGSSLFTLEGFRNVECETAALEGTIHSKEEAERSELTVKPTYAKCTATILGSKDPATVTLNGCDFRLTYTSEALGAIAAEGWEVTGQLAHLECPVSKQIEIHVFTTEANDRENKPLCTYGIAAQTPGGSIDYKLLEKNAEGDGTSGRINWTITSGTATRVSGTVVNCGKETQSFEIKGEVAFEWFNFGGVMLRGSWDLP